MIANETETNVTLTSGEVVSIEAFNLAIDLEGRGIRFEVHGARIICGPAEKLTPLDRASIRRLQRDLVAVIKFCARAM